jgi:hypothetical protein
MNNKNNSNSEKGIMWMWDFLIRNDIATEDEIKLLHDINGFTENTMIEILFARTGFTDFKNAEKMYEF